MASEHITLLGLDLYSAALALQLKRLGYSQITLIGQPCPGITLLTSSQLTELNKLGLRQALAKLPQTRCCNGTGEPQLLVNQQQLAGNLLVELASLGIHVIQSQIGAIQPAATGCQLQLSFDSIVADLVIDCRQQPLVNAPSLLLLMQHYQCPSPINAQLSCGEFDQGRYWLQVDDRGQAQLCLEIDPRDFLWQQLQEGESYCQAIIQQMPALQPLLGASAQSDCTIQQTYIGRNPTPCQGTLVLAGQASSNQVLAADLLDSLDACIAQVHTRLQDPAKTRLAEQYYLLTSAEQWLIGARLNRDRDSQQPPSSHYWQWRAQHPDSEAAVPAAEISSLQVAKRPTRNGLQIAIEDCAISNRHPLGLYSLAGISLALVVEQFWRQPNDRSAFINWCRQQGYSLDKQDQLLDWLTEQGAAFI